MAFESKRNIPTPDTKRVNIVADIDDYKDAPYYALLRRVPRGLFAHHIQKIEESNFSPEEATAYLENVLSKRIEVMTTTVVSEPRFQSVFQKSPHIIKDIETSVFTGENNFLGSGTTAKVKRMDIPLPDGTTATIAVKYVVHPTAKTLSASGEHDVVYEAELLTTIENLEEREHINKDIIRVPHPFFHHTTDKLQCYGMECIDGINLQEALEEDTNPKVKEILRILGTSRLATLPVDEIFAEVEKFFAAIHEYCLHGDIKPRNIMVSRTGTLYIIDFGQAVLNNNISEKEQEQMLNLREEEVLLTRQSIVYFLQKLQAEKHHANRL